ncbi:MAG: M15 family metallopeptidase, partial [Clostridia bacterium]|nr:M15 family metallopeptidase [Clostridia bacterium]
GFFRFLVVLLVLIVGGVLVFAFVNNKEPVTNNGETGNSATNETTVQTTGNETAGTTSTDETTGDTKPQDPVYTYEFKADLSEYEEYMNPQGEQRDAYLVLVNTKNPLASDYVPDDMIDVKSTRKDGRATQKLRLYAAKALEALMLEGDACGIIDTKTPSGYPLSVMSAYRSYAYQNQLFNTYVGQEMNSNKSLTRAEAEKIVETYSCRAGTSEHQSGLCVDMHTLWSAGQAFKNEDEAKWLAENCYKFGFILRFPEDKMEQTGGIIYEPWHFRYVGRYHATQMHELDMCLEEYVEYLSMGFTFEHAVYSNKQ